MFAVVDGFFDGELPRRVAGTDVEILSVPLRDVNGLGRRLNGDPAYVLSGFKRQVTIADIEKLQPFHWGFEFGKVLNERGGFDAIITNPPWEIFKPNSKEFFEGHSGVTPTQGLSVASGAASTN
jgi:hypothetical protein